MTRNQEPGKANGSGPKNHGSLYEIRIKGHLGGQWLDWFEGMTLRYDLDEETGLELTEIRGLISDQPALHGLLDKIRDLNLTLISVRRLPGPGPKGSAADQHEHP